MANYIKSVVDEKGLAVLNDPTQVCIFLKEKTEADSTYPDQVELLLKVVDIGKLVQSPEKIKGIGKASYDAMVMRAVKKTGFTYSLVKQLMQDIVTAAGVSFQDIYFTECDKSAVVSLMLDENQKLLREKDAFDRAMGLLDPNGTPDWYIKSQNIELNIKRAAIKLLKRSAEDGWLPAYGILGICHYYGIGTATDWQEAWRCMCMPGALENGRNVNDRRKIYAALYDDQEKIQKERVLTLGLTFFTVFMVAAMIFVTGFHMWLGFAFIAAAATAGYTAYELIVRRGNLKFMQYSTICCAVVWLFSVMMIM